LELDNGADMEKIIHKLDKESRYKIAVNYVNDKYDKEIKGCTVLSDRIAKDLIDTFHSIDDVAEDKFITLCNTLDKMNYTTQFFNTGCGDLGRVILNLDSGRRNGYSRGLSFRVYQKNNFEFKIVDGYDYTNLVNSSNSNSKIIYSALIKRNISDDLTYLEENFNELQRKTTSAFNNCYELLKKVRTAELLMKHWSDAHKYLPDDMVVLEPDSLTMSDKFKLL
jgi:hypothetical protein